MNFPKIESHIKQKYEPRSLFSKFSPTKYTMPTCHFIGANMWVLKTTSQNRGRGIHVFKSFKDLKQIIRQYIF